MRPVIALALAGLARGQIRSIDGTNTSTENPTWYSTGSTFRPTTRYYDDGISTPRSAGLPNPRNVSNTVFAQAPFVMNEFGLSSMLVAFGQFVAHDLIRTLPMPNATGADIISVEITPGPDEVYESSRPMNITRTRADAASGTSPVNQRQQTNGVTSLLDASVVYGSTAQRAAELREFVGGRLLADPINGVPLNSFNNSCLFMEHAGAPACGQRLAGDDRANIAPGLLALHGLFVLSHNWWAARIDERPPGGLDDETLYQEARKRVMAEVQAITFQEYVPALLGAPLPPYGGYNPSIDARIDVSFAIAAYRYGHSGINTIYPCISDDGSECASGHLVLRDVFFRPSYLNSISIVDILRGLVTHPESAIDTRMVPDVRNQLEGMRLDLAVVDIVRGRDFGLPSYCQARAQLGLPLPASFADITTDVTLQAALASLYGDVCSVELWVGGLAESSTAGAMVGPTFAAIIRDGLWRLREGDRLFYNNRLLTGPNNTGLYLPMDDLKIVTQTRLATIIARVTSWKNPPGSMFSITPVSQLNALSVAAAVTPVPAPSSLPATSAPLNRVALSEALSLEWAPPAPGETQLTLSLLLVAPASVGWAGLGLGTAMSDADIWLFTFNATANRGTVRDASSIQRVRPPEDAQQDVRLISAALAGGVIRWTVTRDLTTNDTAAGRDRPIGGGPTPIIFAYSATTETVSYHGILSRGASTVDFFAPALGAPTVAPAALRSPSTTSQPLIPASLMPGAPDLSAAWAVGALGGVALLVAAGMLAVTLRRRPVVARTQHSANFAVSGDGGHGVAEERADSPPSTPTGRTVLLSPSTQQAMTPGQQQLQRGAGTGGSARKQQQQQAASDVTSMGIGLRAQAVQRQQRQPSSMVDSY